MWLQAVPRQLQSAFNQRLCQIHSLVCLLPSSRKCSSCPLCSSSADLTMKIKQNAMYSDTQLAQLHDIKTRLGQLHQGVQQLLRDFFLMKRPPPRSALFPYTTLF